MPFFLSSSSSSMLVSGQPTMCLSKTTILAYVSSHFSPFPHVFFFSKSHKLLDCLICAYFLGILLRTISGAKCHRPHTGVSPTDSLRNLLREVGEWKIRRCEYCMRTRAIICHRPLLFAFSRLRLYELLREDFLQAVRHFYTELYSMPISSWTLFRFLWLFS